MYISDDLISFLHTTKILSNSAIILTDLEKVVFADSDECNNNDYLNKFISENLRILLNSNFNNNSFPYILNNLCDIIPIVFNDKIKYISQMILPIKINNNIIGALIFVTDNRKYLPSNLKFAKTTKYFTEKFLIKNNF